VRVPPSGLSHPYLQLQPPGVYHGSWVLVGDWLTRHRIGFELDLSEACLALAGQIAGDELARRACGGTVRVRVGNGFAHLDAMGGECDLVLIDPPYWSDPAGDWTAVTRTAQRLGHRDTPFLIWYPLNDPGRRAALLAAARGTAHEILWRQSESGRGGGGAGVVLGNLPVARLVRESPQLEALARILGGRYGCVGSGGWMSGGRRL
jgi:23S rRNA A2030 N6-methylase RlmJ